MTTEDRRELDLFNARARKLNRPYDTAFAAFRAARAAMSAVLPGRQKTKQYLEARRKGFSAARRAALS